ncbi:sulfotransferase domain-containing protein [Lacinutrix undariae]
MDKKFLLKAIEFDDKNIDYQEMVNNLDTLEKAHKKLHGLLIATRMKKIMLDFGQKDTDVYIVSYPRSGTTLMQMMLYQMTTDGDLGFNHIYDVSLWCRYSAFTNKPMKSVGKRRIIKTHDSYETFETAKKCKFIFLMRDCLDVISSVYQQSLDYIDPETDFNQLSDRNMKRWFDYNSEWIENRNELDIFTLNYEDLIERKENAIHSISKFLNINIDNETFQRVIQNTSFDFMKKNESKFGEQRNDWKVYNNFIRKGKIGEGKNNFNERQLQTYSSLSKSYKIENTPLERYFK